MLDWFFFSFLLRELREMNDVSKQYHLGLQYKDDLEVRSPVVHTCGPHVYVASCFFPLLPLSVARFYSVSTCFCRIQDDARSDVFPAVTRRRHSSVTIVRVEFTVSTFRHTQPAVKWVFTLHVNHPGCVTGHPPPSAAKMKKIWNYTSVPPILHV